MGSGAEAETAAAAQADEQKAPAWHLAKRVAFRFAFSYIALYYTASVVQAIPYAGYLVTWYTAAIAWLERWVGLHLFHLGVLAQRRQTGSGDTALDYVQQLILLVLALAGGLLWTALDRRRPHYVTLHGWLRVLARYALAFTLLSYGFAKVFPTQFSHLSPKMMLEPYGESSPMALLWNFMGYSTAYTIFAGLAEAMPALLLLFRRTALLGACIASGVLLNVVLLNFCYDVPVKLYSINLLLLAIFLVSPDSSRLAALFFQNRAVPPALLAEPRLSRTGWRRAALAAKFIVLTVVLGNTVWQQWYYYRKSHTADSSMPFSGVYIVEDVQSSSPGAELQSNQLHWHRLLAAYPKWSWVWPTEGTSQGAQTEYDQKSSRVTFRTSQEEGVTPPVWREATFRYAIVDNNRLKLEGAIDNRPVILMLAKQDLSHSLLTSRGFHWMQEYPYNR